MALSTPIIHGLLLALVIIISAHAPNLPIWVTASTVLFGFWRGMIASPNLLGRYAVLPPISVLLVLGISGVVGIHRTYHTIFGPHAGIVLLVLLLGLKLLELKDRRDVVVIIFLGYFVEATVFLRSQSLATSFHMALGTLALTAVLIAVNESHVLPTPRRLLITAATFLLQAAPIALLLFLLFPRLEHPLWAIPDFGRTGNSGLGEDMEPGDMNQLSLSEEVAFRVAFVGKLPPGENRYWRGPVFDTTNGRRWWSSTHASDIAPVLKLHAHPITYTITLEPHRHRWLFALEMPTPAPEIGSLEPNLQLLAPKEVIQRMRYQLTSYLDYRMDGLAPVTRQRNLALPEEINPQTQALGVSWAKAVSTPRAFVDRLLAYLRKEPFYYTLSPPLLGRNAVDDFLFNTRRGYCEHYASATAFLLRVGGIPARVVTGYLGGEYNSLGSYLIVRQMDAHAWVEAWLDGDGWVRIDPTAVLPPERVSREQAATWSAQPSRILSLIGPSEGIALEIWRNLRRSWDAVNNRWNQFILGYDARRRNALLDHLGLGGLSGEAIALLMGCSILLFLGGLAFQLVGRSSRSRDPLLKDWESFCHQLARIGLARSFDEGPLAYAQRVAVTRPDLAQGVSLVARLYARLRYGRHASRTGRRHLRRLMRRVSMTC